MVSSTSARPPGTTRGTTTQGAQGVRGVECDTSGGVEGAATNRTRSAASRGAARLTLRRLPRRMSWFCS
jgi:hypothetical protein